MQGGSIIKKYIYFTCVVAVTEFEIWVSWPWKTFFTPVLGFEMALGKTGCRTQSRKECTLRGVYSILLSGSVSYGESVISPRINLHQAPSPGGGAILPSNILWILSLPTCYNNKLQQCNGTVKPRVREREGKV